MKEADAPVDWKSLERDIEAIRLERRNSVVRLLLESERATVSELGDVVVSWDDMDEDVVYTLQHEKDGSDIHMYRLIISSLVNDSDAASVIFDNYVTPVQIVRGRPVLDGYELEERLYDVLVEGAMAVALYDSPAEH